MSETSAETPGPQSPAARAVIARAATAEARAGVALRAAIDDAFLSADARLDDRTRVAMNALVAGLIATIGDELREHAARLLTARGEPALAQRVAADDGATMARLVDAGLLRDADLVAECVARVRLELLGAALPVEAPDEPEAPSLLSRLLQSHDRVVAAAAAQVLAGESHRRSVAEGGALGGTGFPAALHQRLVWWIAASLRERAAGEGAPPETLDRAVAEAALRNIAAHDEDDRLETAAMRLAEAIDASAAELPALLDEALRDRRPVLFVAFLAHASALGYGVARDVVLDPGGERLWLALRALGLRRTAIARAGFLLSEADPRRDVEGFADTLDAVAAIDPAEAHEALAPFRLHPDYRAALAALARGAGR